MQRFFYYDGELRYPGGRQGMWTWQADLATASVCGVAVKVSDNRLTRKKQRALLHYCGWELHFDPDGMILQSFNSSTPSAPDYQTASRPASGAPKTFLSHKYCSIGRTLQFSIPGSLLTSPGSLPLLPDREKISIVAGTTAITVMDPTAAPQTSNGIFQKGTIERLTGHAFSSVSAPGVPTLVPDLTIANGSFVLNVPLQTRPFSGASLLSLTFRVARTLRFAGSKESIAQGIVIVQLPFFCGHFGAKGLEARDLSPWPSLEDIFADMRSRARSLYAQVPSAVPLYDVVSYNAYGGPIANPGKLEHQLFLTVKSAILVFQEYGVNPATLLGTARANSFAHPDAISASALSLSGGVPGKHLAVVRSDLGFAVAPINLPFWLGDRPDGTLYTRAKGQPRFPGAFSVRYKDLYGRMFYICILSVHWKASANAAQVQWDLEILLAVKEFLNIEFGCAQSTIVLGDFNQDFFSQSFADLVLILSGNPDYDISRAPTASLWANNRFYDHFWFPAYDASQIPINVIHPSGMCLQPWDINSPCQSCNVASDNGPAQSSVFANSAQLTLSASCETRKHLRCSSRITNHFPTLYDVCLFGPQNCETTEAIFVSWNLDHFAVDRNLVNADAVQEYLAQHSGAAVASMQELGAAWGPNWGPAQDATWRVPTNDAPFYFGKQLFSRLYNPNSMDDDSPALSFDQVQCGAVRYAHPGNNPASTAKSLVYCLYQVKQGSTTKGFNMVASIHDYAGSSGQTPAPLSSGNIPVPNNIGARLEDFCNSHLATVDVATRGTWACDFSGSHVGPFAPYQTRVPLVILDLLYYCGTNWELPENCNNPLSGFQLANQVCAVPQPLSTPQNPLPPVPISRITRPDYVVRDSKIDEYLEGLDNEAICTAATDSQECAGTDLPCRMIAISDHLPVHANLSGSANF
ncbi:hypothetical protein HDU88_000409 [Geranomyces variabilis]|nr:hypothetical protein HDU88_000409 [Geranomyces variabilis]